MSLYELDPQSLELLLELQLRDAQRLRKGKHRQGEAMPDAELALELYQAELESLACFVSDRNMCRSIARAVELDADTIRIHAEVEQQAAQDRAHALGRHSKHTRSHAPPESASLAAEIIDDECLSKLKALYVDEYASFGPAAESSSWAAKRAKAPTAAALRPSQLRSCTACCAGDVPFFDVARCPCSHEYCRVCIASLFRASISDESLFPPRCCGQPIPLDSVKTFLPTRFVGEFRAKELEYGTPNRTYCHRSTCSTFVPPQFICGDTATCPRCRSETCVMCKGASHDDDCPEDVATQDILRIGAENGWQRCHACRRMVELNTGCNHISEHASTHTYALRCFPANMTTTACLCGAQFCYVCGAPWKNCACAQWDEERLLERANVIVDRDAHGRELGAARRAGLVDRERRNLVNHHQCVHDTWRSRMGRYRCDDCRQVMTEFIYECGRCRVLACRRCRYNRL